MRPEDYAPLIREQSFTTLFTSVSGAHLYGFESPDSDVDLRGVFVSALDEVLSLRPPAETVTRTFVHEGTDIDLVAHDVLKFCQLLTRKNGYVLEQLYSPLVVVGGQSFEELRDIARGCIVKPVFFHYRGFLGTQLKIMTRSAAPGPTVKDVLYGYRVALSGIHMLLSGEVEAHLPTLLGHYPQTGVDVLIASKRASQEKGPLPETLRETHTQGLQALEARLVEAFQTSPLADTPTRLDDLSDFVVRVRKGDI